MFQVFFNMKRICRIIVRQFFIMGMFSDVEFFRKEGTDTAKLENTFVSIHDSQFILSHQFFATMSSDEFKKGKKITPLH